MHKLKMIIVLTFALFILHVAFAGTASALLTIKANPNDIKIDFFYNGSTVSVKSEATREPSWSSKSRLPKATRRSSRKERLAACSG
jgi:hypothetical protein